MQIKKTSMTQKTLALAAVTALFLTLGAEAQQRRQTRSIEMPEASPGASVSQVVGLTEIRVDYHRPAVNERDIWGSLVPFDQVWRTGANENTEFTVSTDVMIEGKTLPAGSYGIQTIPGESSWEIIFNHETEAWGNFSYDESKDALRVSVTPVPLTGHQERMLFSFTEVTGDSTTLALDWEKLRVPIKISVDGETTLNRIRAQLQGVSKFFWLGPYQAANYCIQEEMNYEEALQWAETSIRAEERFENLAAKSKLLHRTGKETEAAEVMAKAVDMANASQLFGHGVQLIQEGQKEEALEIFKQNAERNSDAWFVEFGLARGYSALGDFKNAIKNAKIALERAPDNAKGFVEGQLKRLEAGTDIN